MYVLFFQLSHTDALPDLFPNFLWFLSGYIHIHPCLENAPFTNFQYYNKCLEIQLLYHNVRNIFWFRIPIPVSGPWLLWSTHNWCCIRKPENRKTQVATNKELMRLAIVKGQHSFIFGGISLFLFPHYSAQWEIEFGAGREISGREVWKCQNRWT